MPGRVGQDDRYGGSACSGIYIIFISTYAMSAVMMWMLLSYMSCANNVLPANFAMRETNTKLVLIGDRRSKICKAKHGLNR